MPYITVQASPNPGAEVNLPISAKFITLYNSTGTVTLTVSNTGQSYIMNPGDKLEVAKLISHTLNKNNQSVTLGFQYSSTVANDTIIFQYSNIDDFLALSQIGNDIQISGVTVNASGLVVAIEESVNVQSSGNVPFYTYTATLPGNLSENKINPVQGSMAAVSNGGGGAFELYPFQTVDTTSLDVSSADQYFQYIVASGTAGNQAITGADYTLLNVAQIPASGITIAGNIDGASTPLNVYNINGHLINNTGIITTSGVYATDLSGRGSLTITNNGNTNAIVQVECHRGGGPFIKPQNNTILPLVPSGVNSLSSTSTVLSNANALRQGFVLANLSTNNQIVYLGLGTPAVSGMGIALTPAGTWNMDNYSYTTLSINGLSIPAGAPISFQEFD